MAAMPLREWTRRLGALPAEAYAGALAHCSGDRGICYPFGKRCGVTRPQAGEDGSSGCGDVDARILGLVARSLYLKLHPDTQQGGSREGAGRPKRDGKKAKSKGQNGPLKKDAYTKDAAKKTGKSSRTIKREVARGENIDPQALADLAGTCLDNGTELDALAKLPAAEQRNLAEAAKRGEKVSAITARSARDTSDGTEEIELGKVIARLRRDQPRNADTMRICDALEHRLKPHQTAAAR
jgi:hypothetical protein